MTPPGSRPGMGWTVAQIKPSRRSPRGCRLSRDRPPALDDSDPRRDRRSDLSTRHFAQTRCRARLDRVPGTGTVARGAGTRPRRATAMLRMAAVSMTLIVAGLQLFELNGARAQDIAGMEDCTK